MTLAGSVAMVSGGASGIGAAHVARLRDAGALPVVWDVAGTADVVVDVRYPDAVDAAIAATLARSGVPTVVTVCAGIGDSSMLLDTNPDDWDRVFDVNLKGAWLVMRAAAQAMIDHGRAGSIVALSSISGRVADRGMGAYCASKAALDMLVRVAAAEWGTHGIRVNAVAPGVTETPMLTRAGQIPGWLDEVAHRTPLGRIGSAVDVAQVAVGVHGLDWVTGESIAADGGLRLFSPINSFETVERLRNRTSE
jgi:NAD(P)-dependent dehydrogenase (short-subunit alcohol dehydrogenase family)